MTHDEHATTIREALNALMSAVVCRERVSEMLTDIYGHSLAALNALEAALAAARTDNERLRKLVRSHEATIDSWIDAALAASPGAEE